MNEGKEHHHSGSSQEFRSATKPIATIGNKKGGKRTFRRIVSGPRDEKLYL